MVLELPITRGLFIKIQKCLCDFGGRRVTLAKVVFQALQYFCWLHATLTLRPTQLYNTINLAPNYTINHNAYGYIAVGTMLPGPTTDPCDSQPQPFTANPHTQQGTTHPVFSQAHFPSDITSNLVSFK